MRYYIPLISHFTIDKINDIFLLTEHINLDEKQNLENPSERRIRKLY